MDLNAQNTYVIWKVGNWYEVESQSPASAITMNGLSFGLTRTLGWYPWLWLAKMKVRVLRREEVARMEALKRSENKVRIDY